MFGTGELLLILGAILLLFGGKKLPEFARNLGLGIREFKKACQVDLEEPDSLDYTAPNKSKKAEPTAEDE